MVGSYPRPKWFTQQLLGPSTSVWAFKSVDHAEAFNRCYSRWRSATQGSWPDSTSSPTARCASTITSGSSAHSAGYMYERIPGFEPAKEEHPSALGGITSKEVALLSDWGGVINSGSVAPGPIRLADLISWLPRTLPVPSKSRWEPGQSISPGTCISSTTRAPATCPKRFAPIFKCREKALVAAGATFLQYEDLGAWLPAVHQ